MTRQLRRIIVLFVFFYKKLHKKLANVQKINYLCTKF